MNFNMKRITYIIAYEYLSDITSKSKIKNKLEFSGIIDHRWGRVIDHSLIMYFMPDKPKIK